MKRRVNKKENEYLGNNLHQCMRAYESQSL